MMRKKEGGEGGGACHQKKHCKRYTSMDQELVQVFILVVVKLNYHKSSKFKTYSA